VAAGATLGLVGGAALQAVPVAAAPAVIAVVRTADDHATGSLRAAIDDANAGGSDGVTITLSAGTYTLNQCGPTGPDDTNTAGDLDATGSGPLTITGLGTGATIKQTCSGERVLDQRGTALLSLQNVTITGGRATGRPAVGGGVRAAGPIWVDHSTVADNSARGDVGTTEVFQGADARGGGLSAVGPVTVISSTFAANVAAGGNAVTPSVQGVSGGSAWGGAIDTTAAVTLSASTFSTNAANGGTDGRSVQFPPSMPGGPGGSATGGGVSGGAIHATNVTLDQNVATGTDGAWERNMQPCGPFVICPVVVGYPGGWAIGGAMASAGAVSLDEVTATANHAISGQGTAAWGDFDYNVGLGGAVRAVGPLDVSGGTFRGNTARTAGGAVESAAGVTVNGVRMEDNRGGYEGGAATGAQVSVVGSTFTGNRAAMGGAVQSRGAIDIGGSRFERNLAGGTNATPMGVNGWAALGGAVASRGVLVARTSTFLENGHLPISSSPLGGSCCGASKGGALWSAANVDLDQVTVAHNVSRSIGGGVAAESGSVNATNSTFTANRTEPPSGSIAYAGAIWAKQIDLTASTVTGNSGAQGLLGALTTRQSILADQSGGTMCDAALDTTSAGNNWTDEQSCHLDDPSDHVDDAALLLGPLQDNGGPTPTLEPAFGSPVIDAVPAVSCVAADQRGTHRPQGAACEVGAVEVVPEATINHTFTVLPAGGPRIEGTLTFANEGPSTASDVRVHVVLPGGSRLASSTPPPGWTCATVAAPGPAHHVELRCETAAMTAPSALTMTFVADLPGGLTPAAATAEAWVDSATQTAGTPQPHTVVPLPTLATLGSSFHPVAPTRVLDSRGGTGGWNAKLGAGSPRLLDLGAAGTGVPSDADAVVMNVTATDGSANSFLTVFPGGGAVPNVSNLNFAAGQTIPNLVTVKVGPDGRVAFANAVGETHVVADVVGFYSAAPGDRLVALTPTRVLDSRTTIGGFTGKVRAGVPQTLGVTSAGGAVPPGADAAVLNVTVTGGTANSFLTVFPGGTPTATSNLNFAAGQTTANLVTVKLDDQGRVTFANAIGDVDVVADLVGYYDANRGDLFHAVTPTRLLDSRTATGGWNGPLYGQVDRHLAIEGDAVPGGSSAVVANLTATGATAPSFVTVYPRSAPRPNTSNLNFAAGETIPNLVVARLGYFGYLDLANDNGATHLTFDVFGYFAPT
jgi:hypothetical protein